MKKNSQETRISLVSATQLPCACSPNCFAHAPFTRHCFAHAQAIALHRRKPLLCTCAPHCFAHVQAITLHMRTALLCTCAPHYTAHVHNSQTCIQEASFALNWSRTPIKTHVWICIFLENNFDIYSHTRHA